MYIVQFSTWKNMTSNRVSTLKVDTVVPVKEEKVLPSLIWSVDRLAWTQLCAIIFEGCDPQRTYCCITWTNIMFLFIICFFILFCTLILNVKFFKLTPILSIYINHVLSFYVSLNRNLSFILSSAIMWRAIMV